MFLEPSIFHKWKMDQQAMFQQLQPQGKIALSGDMRADSPGEILFTLCWQQLIIWIM